MHEAYWKQLRRLARGTEEAVLSAHIPASWWHPQGIRKMVKRLEKRGFPWLKGWLFFTLTVDPKRFPNAESAYEHGKDRVRRTIFELRRRGFRIKRYASKLELHQNDYPHWHLLVDSRDFIPEARVTEAWGLGFADVKRVKPNRWKYLFKYVVKSGRDIPAWVLGYPRRIRVFQTSAGFFLTPTPGRLESSRPKDDPSEAADPAETLGEKLRRWAVTGHVRFRTSIMSAKKVTLLGTFRDLIFDHVESGGRVIDWFNYPLQTEALIKCIQT